MSHYRPYPAYRPSGVASLRDIPEGWDVRPLKRLARAELSNVDKLTVEGQAQVRLCNYVDVYKNERIVQTLPFMEASASNDQIDRLTLKQGDVLITKDSETPDDIGIPALVSEDMAGVVCGYHLALLRPDRKYAVGEFIHRALQSANVKAEFSCSALGLTRYGLSKYDIESLKLPVPPLAEQAQIAATLEREVARIDALIAKKTEFIELLGRKRQALIAHAVTKGLDLKAKMRDSGVEWIGEIPQHWTTPALKFVVSTPVTDGPHETPVFVDDGVPFVSAEAVSTGLIDFRKIRGFISHEDHRRFSKKYCPRVGDIFMVKSGATTGVTAIVETETEFNIWSPLAAVRCGPGALPRFMLYFMRSTNFLAAVAMNWSYGTQQNIGMGVIENLRVALPPTEEQQDIAATLDRKTSRLDALEAKTRHSIELLKQRRSALITAAVTGQIDLRELA